MENRRADERYACKFRHALRTLRALPAFALAAVLTPPQRSLVVWLQEPESLAAAELLAHVRPRRRRVAVQQRFQVCEDHRVGIVRVLDKAGIGTGGIDRIDTIGEENQLSRFAGPGSIVRLVRQLDRLVFGVRVEGYPVARRAPRVAQVSQLSR